MITKPWVMIKLFAFSLIFFSYPAAVYSARVQIPSDRVEIRDYKSEPVRIKIAITTSDEEAREVIRMLEEELTFQGFLLAEGGDAILTGKVSTDYYQSRRTNPYQLGEFTLHEVGLKLSGLQIMTPGGTAIIAYRSLFGQGSNQRKSMAFQMAARQILKELRKKGLFQKMASLANRREVLIDLSRIDQQEREEALISFLREYIPRIEEKIVLLGKEEQKRERRLREFIRQNLYQQRAQGGTLSLDQGKLNEILQLTRLMVREKRILHRITDRERYPEDFSQYTGVAILVKDDLGPVKRQMFLEIFDQDHCLVYGGEEALLNPVHYYHSEEEIRESPFRQEGYKLLKVRALSFTAEGNIVVSNPDADRIILANERGMERGSIFHQGRIFIIAQEFK